MKTTIVVSGLSRSGTSLMMQILEALGVPVLISPPGQGVPAADAFNEGGYYEYAPINEKYNTALAADEAVGKAVKLCVPRIDHLPWDRPYYVIWMIRDIQACNESRRRVADKLDCLANPSRDRTDLQAEVMLRASMRRWSFCLDAGMTTAHYEKLIENPRYAHERITVIAQRLRVYSPRRVAAAVVLIRPELQHVK